MRTLHIICLVLVIIGALNWGLIGLFQYDLVAAMFGGVEEPMSRFIYSLVGLAGLILIFTSPAFVGSPRVRHTHGSAAAPR